MCICIVHTVIFVYILYDRPLVLDILLMAFITAKLKAGALRIVIRLSESSSH